jgi:hypothetical protein
MLFDEMLHSNALVLYADALIHRMLFTNASS